MPGTDLPDVLPALDGHELDVGRQPSPFSGAPAADADYARATGETLAQTLDLSKWDTGHHLAEALQRMESEIADAKRTEDDIVRAIRTQVFTALRDRPNRPAVSGVFSASIDKIREVQRTTLFNGLTEGCDATSLIYDTLPIQIIQVGVGLVSYQGEGSTWAQRVFRRDVRVQAGNDIAGEIIDILSSRQGSGQSRLKVTDMLRRAIMTFAERAVITEKATAPWRMGHGNPLAYEILTGSGMADIIRLGVPVLEKLVLDHQKFVFVTSDTQKKHLLTIGNALRPGEYAVIEDASHDLENIFRGNYRGEWMKLREPLQRFRREVGPRVLSGVYRSSTLGPAHLFYAHADHVHEAALIAMADSLLQEHRNFPMLIDIADNLCKTLFGGETILKPANSMFANLGDDYRYLPERHTRN
jgi:hypothetical protein